MKKQSVVNAVLGFILMSFTFCPFISAQEVSSTSAVAAAPATLPSLEASFQAVNRAQADQEKSLQIRILLVFQFASW